MTPVECRCGVRRKTTMTDIECGVCLDYDRCVELEALTPEEDRARVAYICRKCARAIRRELNKAERDEN